MECTAVSDINLFQQAAGEAIYWRAKADVALSDDERDSAIHNANEALHEARRMFASAYPTCQGKLDDCTDPVEMLKFAAGLDAGVL